MAKTFLQGLSKAKYVDYGYAQVEPNLLSAQRTGQIYAQLPANADIDVLENGQFVKYDYATGEVNFTGKGEWMLVFNEIKLYREGQDDCEFAMIKRNYTARVYSPSDGILDEYARDAKGDILYEEDGVTPVILRSRNYTDIVAPADPYSLDATEDPFHIYNRNKVAMMPEGTTMVPRVLKTNIGDIMTTNAINTTEELTVGTTLTPTVVEDESTNAKVACYLAPAASGDMLWQVVKVYTMPDGQRGAKVMRIK